MQTRAHAGRCQDGQLHSFRPNGRRSSAAGTAGSAAATAAARGCLPLQLRSPVLLAPCAAAADGTSLAAGSDGAAALSRPWQQPPAFHAAGPPSPSAGQIQLEPHSVLDIAGAGSLVQLEGIVSSRPAGALTSEHAVSALHRAALLARSARLRRRMTSAAASAAAAADAATAERVAVTCLQHLIQHAPDGVAPRMVGRAVLSVGDLTAALPQPTTTGGLGAELPATLAAVAAAAVTTEARQASLFRAPGSAAEGLQQLLSATRPHAALLQLLEVVAPSWDAAARAAQGGWPGALHPQDTVDAAYGLAKAGIAPPPAFARALLAASQPLLPRMAPRQLAQLAYALARLGPPPSNTWVSAWGAAVRQKAAAFGPQDVSNALWAAATMRRTAAALAESRLSQDGSCPFEAAGRPLYGRARQLAGEMTAQGLANSLWAAAVLTEGAPVGSGADCVWASTMLHCCSAQGRMVEPQEGANALWAVATLVRRAAVNGAPSSPALPRDLGTAQQHLVNQQQGEIVGAAVAAAAGFRDDVLLRLAPRFGPVDWANVLWATGTLGLRLPPAWQEALWQGSTRQLRVWEPRALANAAWALARAHVQPPRGWWAMFEAASLAAVGRFQPRELAMAAWAVGRLAGVGVVAPEDPWWDRLWAVSGARMVPTADGSGSLVVADTEALRHAVMLLHAASLVGRAPPDQWLQAALSTANAAVAADKQQMRIGGMLSASLACRVSRALAALARMSRAGSIDIGTGATASGSIAGGVAPLVEWLAVHAGGLPPAAAVPALAALPDLAPTLSPALRRHAAAALLARCGGLCARPAHVLHALARLHAAGPPAGWHADASWQEISAAGRQQQSAQAAFNAGASNDAADSQGSRRLHARSAHDAFMRRMGTALAHELPLLSPEDAATGATALVRLGHVASPNLALALLAASDSAASKLERLQPSSGGRSPLPALLFAAGSLDCGRYASAAALAGLVVRTQPRLSEWSGPELASGGYGIAALARKCSQRSDDNPTVLAAALRPWLRMWLQLSCVLMQEGGMAPCDVMRAAAALARLRVKPSDSWLSTAVGATLGRLRSGKASMAPPQLVRLAVSLLRLGAAPPAVWHEELAGAVVQTAEVWAEQQQEKEKEQGQQSRRQRSGRLEPVHVGALALAWSQWGWQPPVELQERLLAASAPALATSRSARVQVALTLLAAAGWTPPADWVKAAAARASAAASRGAYSEAQCDKVSWALSVISGPTIPDLI